MDIKELTTELMEQRGLVIEYAWFWNSQSGIVTCVKKGSFWGLIKKQFTSS